MAKAAHVVVEGHCPGVYKTYSEVLEQIKGYDGKVNFGYDSMAEAQRVYKVICDWRALSPENASEKLTIAKAKYVINQMQRDPSVFNINESKIVEKPCSEREVALLCVIGTKGPESTIATCAAELVEKGIDVVNIYTLDPTVIPHLADWAAKSRDRGWINGSGKPMANRDVLEPMLALYEQLVDKVKLHNEGLPLDESTQF
ncbi:ribonuclease H family protein [Photobacterium damselae]|nr:ribonuclease H family protein [Photobacterium damselae]